MLTCDKLQPCMLQDYAMRFEYTVLGQAISTVLLSFLAGMSLSAYMITASTSISSTGLVILTQHA